MYCKCNEGCNEEFKIQLKEKKFKNGIIETYFECPSCGKKYICFFTDKDIRRLQSKLRNACSKVLVPEKENKKIQFEIETKMNKLKEKMIGAQ